MPVIRPYAAADRGALFDVCVQTADAGSDARGLLSDDELWGLLFAVPYAERHPDLAWVVEGEDGRIIGYIVATDDTDAFEKWFREEWWPPFTERFPQPTDSATRERELLVEAYARGAAPSAKAAEYPAHLHIDLLPETQGQGLGRKLIETLVDELTRRGVPAVHLQIDPRNVGAAAFYERVGMHRLPPDLGEHGFGLRLAEARST
ncbi:GNAT family N-acetyltransferase [Microbacterium sp.]|uniref:GNAT family N-acetyltransferase n=1 Tax=Microbacterium sp. TaxID=51671 RepID=UPI0026373EFE|nr:GNAT family N-acetyltransferase [Microbacterium sp.]